MLRKLRTKKINGRISMLYAIHKNGEILTNAKNQPMVYLTERNAKIAIGNIVSKPNEKYIKTYYGEQRYLEVLAEYERRIAEYEIVVYTPPHWGGGW
jgi:hypothetical protein